MAAARDSRPDSVLRRLCENCARNKRSESKRVRLVEVIGETLETLCTSCGDLTQTTTYRDYGDP